MWPLAGFATLEAERSLESLPVEGAIPEWLTGTLVRNGPGKFEIGDMSLRHWFDGLAMLHRFSFAGGRVSYANRYLRTEAFRAAERGAELAVDLMVYDGPDVIDALYLDELRASPPSEAVHGRFHRYRIDLEGGAVADEQLCGEMFELPQIDYERCNGRPYRYVYGAAVDSDTGGEPADFLDQIVKVDLESGELAVWQEPGSYPGEAIFVPSPRRGRREDEGVLLSVVLDCRDTGSYLLVLDAETFTELGRARLPHHVPFGFHGQYFD